VPLAASKVSSQTLGSVLGIIYIFLLLPLGILRMIDIYRTNDGATLPARIFNAVFRVPLALFGLVFIVVGVALIGWVLWNVFVERQKVYSGPHFISGWGSFGVGVPLVLYGWLTLRSVARRKKNVNLSPEEREEFEHEEDDEEHAG